MLNETKVKEETESSRTPCTDMNALISVTETHLYGFKEPVKMSTERRLLSGEFDMETSFSSYGLRHQKENVHVLSATKAGLILLHVNTVLYKSDSLQDQPTLLV